MGTTTYSINLNSSNPSSPRVNFAGKYPNTDASGGDWPYYAIKGSFLITAGANGFTGNNMGGIFEFPRISTFAPSVTLNLLVTQYQTQKQNYTFSKFYNLLITAHPDQPSSSNTYFDLYEQFSNPNSQYPTSVNNPVWQSSLLWDFANDRFILKPIFEKTIRLNNIFKGIYYLY